MRELASTRCLFTCSYCSAPSSWLIFYFTVDGGFIFSCDLDVNVLIDLNVLIDCLHAICISFALLCVSSLC